METDEEGFLAGHYYEFLFTAKLQKLNWIFTSSGRDGMQNLAWRIKASLRVLIKMPGLFCGV
jgi:hypothetical protein